MSVLRNKIYRETGLPESIRDGLDVWKSMHLAVSDCLVEMIGSDWERSSISVAQVESKGLASNFPETGLAYSFVSADGKVPVFAHFDKAFAALISSKTLSLDTSSADDEYSLQMLDLILFKPIRDILAKEVSGLFRLAKLNNANLSVRAQGLSAASFEIERGLGMLNHITFSVKQVAPEAKNGEETIKEEDLQILNFSVVLPQNVSHQIVSARASDAPISDAAPSGPWTDHIYQSMKTATIPIRAVVESCSMTVADCTRLEVDDIIKLPGASLQSVSLQTEMREGSVKIGLASLGIYKSNWALKLSGDLNEEIFVSLKSQEIEGSM